MSSYTAYNQYVTRTTAAGNAPMSSRKFFNIVWAIFREAAK